MLSHFLQGSVEGDSELVVNYYSYSTNKFKGLGEGAKFCLAWSGISRTVCFFVL